MSEKVHAERRFKKTILNLFVIHVRGSLQRKIGTLQLHICMLIHESNPDLKYPSIFVIHVTENSHRQVVYDHI